MKIQHRVETGLVGLLLLGMVPESAGRSDCGGWNALCGKNMQVGLRPGRVDQMVEHCRKKGMSPGDTQKLMAPVVMANEEGLPTECVFVKIEEGLAKQVEQARIVAAAEARLGYLRRARELLPAGSSGHGRGGLSLLITRACFALESGLPEEVLKEVVGRSGGFRYGRLVQVLEAGETLQLAGLDPRDTQQVMNDCLDRNLNRPEIIRVVGYVIAEHRKGIDFKEIHAGLWVCSD